MKSNRILGCCSTSTASGSGAVSAPFCPVCVWCAASSFVGPRIRKLSRAGESVIKGFYGGAEHMTYEERWGELGLISLVTGLLMDNLTAAYRYLPGS